MCENNNSGFKNHKHHKLTGKNFLEILIIILISVSSGFILGLLFAPRSGLKTRKIIDGKLKDMMDRGKFTLTEAKVMGEELLEKSKEKVGKVSSKIRGKIQTDNH